MKTIEQLEKEAAERRKNYVRQQTTCERDAEAALDQAIAIAKELDRLRTEVTMEVIESEYAQQLSQAEATIKKLERECEYVRDIEAQRDKANERIAELEALMPKPRTTAEVTELRKQRDQARADVLKLRDLLDQASDMFAMDDGGWLERVKADTEHYEEYR